MKEMRPTTGRVLLALFNILGPLKEKSFLDLFSGSGQIAMEASKRGATLVYSVESDKKRYAELVRRVPKDAKCLCMDVRRAVPRFSKRMEKFDIIFADPPYGLDWGLELPSIIGNNGSILSDEGIFIYEHSDKEKICELDLNNWSRDDRVYGGTILSFYKRRN